MTGCVSGQWLNPRWAAAVQWRLPQPPVLRAGESCAPVIDNTILMPQTRARRPGGRLFLLLLVLVAVIVLGGRGAVSWYVDALWFGSLGYSAVFWKTLTLQWSVFGLFFGATFLIL